MCTKTAFSGYPKFCSLFPWVTLTGECQSSEGNRIHFSRGTPTRLTQPEVQVVLEVPTPLFDGVQHQIRISCEEVSVQIFWHRYQIKFLNPPNLKARLLPSLRKLSVLHHADRLRAGQRMLFNPHSTRKLLFK